MQSYFKPLFDTYIFFEDLLMNRKIHSKEQHLFILYAHIHAVTHKHQCKWFSACCVNSYRFVNTLLLRFFCSRLFNLMQSSQTAACTHAHTQTYVYNTCQVKREIALFLHIQKRNKLLQHVFTFIVEEFGSRIK